MKKVIFFMSGGHESGFDKSEDDLEELISYWDTDITFEFKKGIKEVSLDTFIEMSDYYNKGYKVISMGIPINSMIASITETDIIDPSDAGKANPSTIFNRDYVNYNPITVKGMKEFRDFEVFPVYHPLFFIGTKMLGGLFGIISRVQKYIDMDPREGRKNATHSRNLEEFKSFVERYRTDTMAFDVETNFVSPYDKGFEIVGFSISFDGQNGTYINLRECQDKDLILKELVNLFDNSKKVLIHNIKMELPALLNYLDYKLPYEKVVDTLVKSKLINSGRTGSNGLKEQAVIRLGYSDWSVDVDRIQSYKENLYNQYAKMKRSKGEKVYNLDSYEQAEVPEGMKELISKYYGIDEVDEVLDNLKSNMFNCARNLTYEYWNSFGLIPNKILSRYGAIDAIATWDLNNLYEKMFKKLSVRFNIELDKGYDLWMESMYASYILELNSCRWDEAQAKLDEDTYLETMKEDLIALLRSDHKSVRDLCKEYISKDVVKSYMETKGKELIESNPKFEGYTGTSKIRYRGEDGKLKNVAPDKYQDLIDIFSIDLNALHIEIETSLEEFLNKGIYSLDHSELSSILNVNSDAGKKVVMELLEDEITCSTNFLLHLISHTTTEKFQIEKANKMYSEDELKFIDFVCTYDQNWKPNKKLEWYEEVMERLIDLKMETTMSDMVSRSANWRMSTVDEANMTELFNLFKMAGYDIDNDHDNDDAFSRLFHLRRYKKVNKLLTTYINGTSLGRSQVKVVDKDTFQDGRKMTRRGRSLDGKPIKDNEDYLFQGSWNANSVLSGRWSSGIHTIPAWSDQKRYLAPPFKGGCSVIMDFSQAEIRVVATAANETNLLEAYAKGIDVHMVTAMGIFKKPASEINETERRFSKMGCVVGDTEVRVVNDKYNKFKKNYITVKELYDMDRNGELHFPITVLSCNRKGEVVLGKCIGIQLTKVTNELTTTTFSHEGQFEKEYGKLVSTPNHPILSYGNEWFYVEASRSEGLDMQGYYLDNFKVSTRVEKVETELVESVPVYDLMVEEYNNYLIKLNSNLSVFVHNTFHIIYGGDPEGFAANNLNGDVAEAQKIFDGFFSTYPALKVWQQGKNEEVKNTGYVTSMTNRFTFLGYEAPGVDVNKIVRQSGNVPIQGPSSDIAAGAIFNIIKFTEEKNMRSQMYCFVHDSIEANVPPDELFYMIESFQYQMNTYPRVTFGVSTKSDVTIGASLGEEVEVKYYKPDEDYKGGVLELEGHTDEVERLLQRWSEFWDVIDVTIYERKYSMMSYKDLFAVKRSYTKRIGKMNGDMKLRVRLRYDKGEGCKIPWINESLFPQVDPIIRSTIVPRYRSGNVDIILTDGLKGKYVNGGTEQEFEFKSKEEMKDYFKKYNFVQVEGYEIKE